MITNLISNASGLMEKSEGSNNQGISNIASIATIGVTALAGAGSIFGIASSLLSVAGDAGSASSKVAEGSSAISEIKNLINEVISKLGDNTEKFKGNKLNTSALSKKCQSVGSQGTAQLLKSIGLVNGNGNMVGLDVNIEGSQNKAQGAANSNGAAAGGCAAGQESSSAASAGGQEQAVATNEAEAPAAENTNTDNAQVGNIVENADTNEPKRVYSCDWGNGAMSAEEVENENNNIANNAKGNNIDGNGRKLNDADGKDGNSKKSALNNKNKELNEKLKGLQNKKNNILKNQNNKNEDDGLDELKARVQGDSSGVETLNSQNESSVAKEEKLKNLINKNIGKGQEHIQKAKGLTNEAKTLATSSIASLGAGIASNTAAIPLFADELTYSAAHALAATAAAENGIASKLAESASKKETESQNNQNGAANIMEQTLSSIMPQFQQSVQGRLSSNKQSVDIQNNTRKIIQQKKKEQSNPAQDLASNQNNKLKDIMNQENMLLNQKAYNQMEISNNNYNESSDANISEGKNISDGDFSLDFSA